MFLVWSSPLLLQAIVCNGYHSNPSAPPPGGHSVFLTLFEMTKGWKETLRPPFYFPALILFKAGVKLVWVWPSPGVKDGSVDVYNSSIRVVYGRFVEGQWALMPLAQWTNWGLPGKGTLIVKNGS